MDTTFRKSLPFGEPESHAKFQVKAFVLGDGQVWQQDHRHEYSGFGQTGSVPLRPTGHGTINFEIAAEYHLVYNPPGLHRPTEHLKGSFRHRYWVDYSSEKGDNDPYKLDYRDLWLDNTLHHKVFEEKGSNLFRLTGTTVATKDGPTTRYPPYVQITPTFELPTIQKTGGGESGVGGVGIHAVASWSDTTSPPAGVREWGHFRLDLHVLEISLPMLKPPKEIAKVVNPAFLFVIIPFKHDRRTLTQSAKDIASAWKRKLFETYPKLERAIRDQVVRVYFDGYASKTGSDEYNFQIGKDRASAAIDYLAPQLGLRSEQISAKTFGEEKSKWGAVYDETLKKNVEKVGKPRDSDQIVIAYLIADDVAKLLNEKPSR